jgi:hypothetical protein
MLHDLLRCRKPAPEVTLLCALLLCPAGAAGQALRADLPRIERAPTLDDFLDGRAREAELRITSFTQRDPNDGEPATQPTTAYLSYDSRNLYVAFACIDREPHLVRGRLSKRDAIAQDDQVVVWLDTFHDRQRSYLFAVNPLGVQADAVSSEGRDDDYTFDTVWRADGRRTADGFVVLMTIPFKSLRIATGADATWGIALARLLPRNSEQSYWPAITRKVEGTLQQFATMASPQRVSGGTHLQLIPYSAVSSGRYLDNGTGTYAIDTISRFGGDGKIVFRDAVALDVAVNPDFSQVESDQPQVAVNQRFELFYPEKRPFFLENAASFKYVRTAPSDPTMRLIPEMLFFSRRVQDPRFGARITGKSGPWSFGGIVADDRGVGAAAASGGRAAIAVGRLQREFGNQSSAGLFITSRERDGDGNTVGAFDLRWKLAPNWIFAGQAVASRTQHPDGSRSAGPAYNASLFYSSRAVLYSLFYSDRSPSFRTALGFVPRTDIRQIEQYGEYRWRPRGGPVVAYGPNTYIRLNWDRQGRLQEWIVRLPFEVHLKGRTQIFIRRVQSYELFNGVDLRTHVQTVNVTTEWIKWLSINEGFEWGATPNYFPAAGSAPHVAHSTSGSLGLTFRPTPRVRYEQTYLFSRLATIFRNHITRSTVNYQFTRELSLRAIADYNAVMPNPVLVRLTNDKRIGVEALLTYQVGPGTAVYVGYSTGFQNVAPSATTSGIERIATPSTEIGRQFFLKLSYLIRG